MRRVLDTFAIPRTTTYNKYDKQRTTTIETIDSSSETNSFFLERSYNEKFTDTNSDLNTKGHRLTCVLTSKMNIPHECSEIFRNVCEDQEIQSTFSEQHMLIHNFHMICLIGRFSKKIAGHECHLNTDLI